LALQDGTPVELNSPFRSILSRVEPAHRSRRPKRNQICRSSNAPQKAGKYRQAARSVYAIRQQRAMKSRATPARLGRSRAKRNPALRSFKCNPQSTPRAAVVSSLCRVGRTSRSRPHGPNRDAHSAQTMCLPPITSGRYVIRLSIITDTMRSSPSRRGQRISFGTQARTLANDRLLGSPTAD
jgi:hypothetical protein